MKFDLNYKVESIWHWEFLFILYAHEIPFLIMDLESRLFLDIKLCIKFEICGNISNTVRWFTSIDWHMQTQHKKWRTRTQTLEWHVGLKDSKHESLNFPTGSFPNFFLWVQYPNPLEKFQSHFHMIEQKTQIPSLVD